MQRGEIYTAIWPNDPSIKPRPVLIVSNNLQNNNSAYQDILVCKITSYLDDTNNPKKINSAVDKIITLKKQSIIQCSKIFTLNKTDLVKQIGQISIQDMKDVDRKLKVALDLP